MRTIKRYANRKLYDTQEKRYLTLAHLCELVSDGEKIRVLDNDSGEDITNVVLSKALSGKEKESGGFLPTDLLSNLLQRRPHQLLEYLKRSWKVGSDYLKDVEAELDGRLKPYIDRGKMTTQEAMRFKDSLLEGLRGRWADLESSVGKGLSGALGAIPIASRNDMERLEKRLETLTERLDELDLPAGDGGKKKRSTRKKKATAKRSTRSSSGTGRGRSTQGSGASGRSKKSTAEKSTAKKKTTRKASSKKKTAAKKTTAKKTAAKKTAAKKTTGPEKKASSGKSGGRTTRRSTKK